MADAPRQTTDARDKVELPRPTSAPIVLSLGLALCGAGVATGAILLAVGGIVAVAGLALWIAELLPGRGHEWEPITAAEPAVVPKRARRVERLVVGKPGYRLRLPVEVHPLSAGVKGGIVGGLVMPLPALGYGVWSGHGIWYVINLLAGMTLPGVDRMTVAELEQFHPTLLVIGGVVHAVMSLVIGLVYGVLMPTLPDVPKPIAWGGLLMPLFWTAVSYVLMGSVNPALRAGVDWPWFIASQFVFGVVAAIVVMRVARLGPALAGLIGGLIGGGLMALPAFAWSLLTGHGIWYPVNLLAGMAIRGVDAAPLDQLERYNAEWFGAAVMIHAALSAVFGVVYAFALPRVPAIPGPLAWGGLVLPLLWTAASYGLMGVVNPVLQQRVDWPWFIVSQFVFGLAAAMIVTRSETIHVPPAGAGPDSYTDFIEARS